MISRTTRPHIHKALATALELLIGDDSSLSLRLTRAADVIASLSPDTFDDYHLHRQFRALRDDLVMMDLPNNGTAPEIDAEAVMTLSIRILDLIFRIAQRESMRG